MSPSWTCPRCDRRFGRANRAHVCEPGLPVEVWLETLPEPQRRAAVKVLAIVRRYAGVIVEAVSIGVLVKRERTLVELRPKQRWLQLSFVSAATVVRPRISRAIQVSDRTAYFVRVADDTAIDAELRRWLADALRSRR